MFTLSAEETYVAYLLAAAGSIHVYEYCKYQHMY